MGATLQALLQLYEIEQQIFDIRRQLSSREQAIARQLAKIQAAEKVVEAERAEARRAQMGADEIDLDLRSRQASITKLSDSLKTVKTNKEYSAILSQLNTERAEKSRVETRAYELLEVVEQKKKSVAEKEALLTQERGRLKLVEDQLAATKGTFGDRLASLESQRAAAGGGVRPEAMAVFNRVSERHQGEAIARIVRVHPKRDDFLCEGCNMSVTVDRANVLLTRDDVITCDSCGRILYMERGT